MPLDATTGPSPLQPGETVGLLASLSARAPASVRYGRRGSVSLVRCHPRCNLCWLLNVNVLYIVDKYQVDDKKKTKKKKKEALMAF